VKKSAAMSEQWQSGASKHNYEATEVLSHLAQKQFVWALDIDRDVDEHYMAGFPPQERPIQSEFRQVPNRGSTLQNYHKTHRNATPKTQRITVISSQNSNQWPHEIGDGEIKI
jgi:hypothetical protein